jgi:TRAP-type mannitol/chloroaromatic compound transport system permease large subunit
MMSWAPQIGLTMFVVMILLMALRVPIAVAMFIPGLIGYGLMSDVNTTLNFLKGSAVARLTVYELSVIPLFLLMGQFATQGGLSRDLFKAAAPWRLFCLLAHLVRYAVPLLPHRPPSRKWLIQRCVDMGTRVDCRQRHWPLVVPWEF